MIDLRELNKVERIQKLSLNVSLSFRRLSQGYIELSEQELFEIFNKTYHRIYFSSNSPYDEYNDELLKHSTLSANSIQLIIDYILNDKYKFFVLCAIWKQNFGNSNSPLYMIRGSFVNDDAMIRDGKIESILK